jgi:hypothetical protein
MPNDTDAARFQTGIEIIAAERARQMRVEGYDAKHDDEHELGGLAQAAACYALMGWLRRTNIADHERGNPPVMWPWDSVYWKPTPKDRVRELAKAGALIAAEIDRLQRRKP